MCQVVVYLWPSLERYWLGTYHQLLPNLVRRHSRPRRVMNEPQHLPRATELSRAIHQHRVRSRRLQIQILLPVGLTDAGSGATFMVATGELKTSVNNQVENLD